MIQEISKYFDRHKLFGLFAGYLLILIVGFLDYTTGYKLGFSIFYLMPISLVVWHLGLRAGITISSLGTIIWVLADCAARKDSPEVFIVMWNAGVRMGFFVTVTVTLANLRLLLEHEKASARTDYLTGIANNQAFEEFLKIESERSTRSQRPLTLVYLDCDHFKIINDRYGHETGNQLLREVALTIQAVIRSTDKAGRLGGDEFLILLPETDASNAENIVFRLQKNLLETMKKNQWHVTFSIGVATFVSPLKSASSMISEADKLMYRAKEEGKNSIVSQTFSVKNALGKKRRKHLPV